MIRPAASAILLTIAAPAAAGDDAAPCTLDNDTCVPFVACIEATGEVFRGRSYGLGAGSLVAGSRETTCTGSWAQTPDDPHLGRALVFCRDGRIGRVLFTWVEPATNTTIGEGHFTDGNRVRSWGGNDLQRYFRDHAPDEIARMSCAPGDLLIS